MKSCASNSLFISSDYQLFIASQDISNDPIQGWA